jgi:GDPmannose 4,6-dehydratase
MNYEIGWKGEGIDEVGYINGQPLVKVDSKYFRPLEVDVLLGDPSLIKQELGWEPRIKFKELVKIMLDGKDD